MKNTSLVTGGAGFIGSHVANHLLTLNHTVVVLDDLSGGDRKNVNDSALFYEGSILDVELINELFKKFKFDYVYHLAAYAAEGLSHFIRRFNYQNNLIGSVNLINAAVNYKIKRFIFTSSIAVYGTNDIPFQEKLQPNPEDPYGIAKYAVEMDLKNAREMFGLNYTIFRPHNVYGPFQNIGDKYRNVVGIFMNQILEKQPLTIFGDGTQTRAFTYIENVAPYIANCINISKTENQIFNIGSDLPYSVKDLAIAVNEAMEANAEIKLLSKREEVEHAYPSHDKFNAVFNPIISTDLKTGLKEMANWVKQNGSKKSSNFDAIEIEEKLPESWK